jgi:hypothetical protein
MKTQRFEYEKLRNEEHYKFYTEFKELVLAADATTLNISDLFAAFLVLFAQEGEALNLILKSAFTAALADADLLRDTTSRGLRQSVKGFANHFVAAKQKAAANIQIVLDSYNDMEVKPYDQETAAITALLLELTGNLAADVQTLGLGDWVAELQRTNDAFDTLMKSRFTDDAGKTTLRMKQTRKAADQCYRQIIDRVDALILINGVAKYTAFISELNQRAERFSNTLAMRQGRSAKKEDEPKVV